MPRIWSSFISLTFLIGVELNSGTCIALPAIDSQVVLQICQAFSKKAPEQMPAVVLPEAAERFVNHYGRFSDLLEGCLSASAISREANGASFLVQNTRYVSYWYFYIDVSAIGDELFGLNHNTFATTRNVLNDLKILLETGKPPPRLTEIRGYPEPPQKATYFRYVP